MEYGEGMEKDAYFCICCKYVIFQYFCSETVRLQMGTFVNIVHNLSVCVAVFEVLIYNKVK